MLRKTDKPVSQMEELIQKIKKFASERDWDQFHAPKNLAMALSVEVAELVEIFQWLTENESYELDAETRSHLQEEIGDILIYLAGLAAKFDINPIDAAHRKLRLNEQKYPSGGVKGRRPKDNR
jgi:NTP pyrophosphatase (non-canonical NTP hydrolase)